MKNMIKSVLAVAATILFASVGLAKTETFSFIMGAETNFTTSATSVKSAESTKGYGDFVEVSFASGKVTFKAKTDTKDELTIVLSNDDVYKITVKTVEIEKTIMPWNAATDGKKRAEYGPDNKSNSTIRVVTHILGINVETRDPNVLFIGTLCGRHSLTNGTVATSLKAANEKANLDYYLFEKASSVSGNVEPTLSGTDIAPGDPLNEIPPTFGVNERLAGERGNHYALAGMLTKLYDISQDNELSNKYDYIILEFDGSRIAENYESIGEEKEKAVARWLKPYYGGNKVFWALDNGFDFDRDVLREDQKGSGDGKMSSSYLERVESGKPADKDFLDSIFAYGTRENGYWNEKRPYVVNSAFLKNSNGGSQFFINETGAGWKGLTALLDPAIRLDERSATTTSASVYTAANGSLSTITILSGQTMPNQMWYDDADKLGAAISAMIRPLPISARIADQVVQSFEGDNGVSFQDMGLNLVGATDEEKKDSIRFYQLKPEQVMGREVTADSDFWGDPLSKEYYDVVLDTMTVTGKVDKTESECWNKIEIDVVDDGTFFQKCLATGRYETGVDEKGNTIYILNPNNGDATVELFDENGNSLLRKDGAVVPKKQWPFEPMAMNATCEDVIAIYNGEGTNVWHYAVTNAKTGEPVVSGYSVSNRYDGASTWYEQGKFPGYTNVVFDADGEITSNKVWFLVVGPEGYTNTAPQFAWVTITQRVVTVEATDASKIYTQPKADDPEFKWDLKAEGTDIVVGEEAGVYEALSNVVELVRVNSKNPSEDPEEDVVADDPFKYVGVITTNTPWATKAGEDELLWNYRVEFLPGDFKINGADLLFADVAGYTNMYDGAEHSIGFVVNPQADNSGRKTQVRFSTDDESWTDWADYDENVKNIVGFPKFKDFGTYTVYVQATNGPNYIGFIETNATVVITQRVVCVRADDATKVYDGEPLTKNTFTVVDGGHGFVSGEGFASNETTMTGESTITDVGEQPNVMDEGAVLPWQEGTKPENYKIERDTGNLKVTKRPIVWGNEGDDPQTDKSLVWVRNAVKVYDGIATGIVVGVKGIAEADLGKVTFTYSETDPDAPKLLKAAALPGKKTDATGPKYKDVLNDEEARTVWCTVSVADSGNYIPCTVSGTVLITRRPITLSSPSKKCLIDELPEGGLTFTDAEIADMTAGQANAGYVKGEVFAYSNRAALDKLGSLPATFDCGDNAPALLNNYTVTKNLGTLQVQKEQEILYPEGDGGQCICDRVTRTYIGTIFYTEPGKNGTIGTLELKTKPKKGGVMDIQAKVYSRIDDRKFTFKTNDVPNCADCGATCPIQVVLNSKGGKCGKCLPDGYRKLVLTIDGDSIMGFFVGCPEGDAYVDASRDAFSSKKTGRWQAILPYVGKWNGAFEVKDGETSLGLAQFNLTLNKSGKTSVKGWMPDGNKYSYSGKAHVGTNDFVAVPILLKKKVGGELRTVGIRVKFDTQLQVVECRNVSPWQTYFKKRDQYENIADLTDGVIGMPEMTKAQFKAESVIVDVPAGSALTPIPFQDKISYNAKTGVASGRLVWKIAGKSCTGKVTGVVIGDELVGVVKVNGYGTYAISFNRPEVQDN